MSPKIINNLFFNRKTKQWGMKVNYEIVTKMEIKTDYFNKNLNLNVF